MTGRALLVFALTGCAGPYDVEDEHVYVDLAVSSAGVCAVDEDQTLHCWGYTALNAPEGVVAADVDMSGSRGCVTGDDGSLTCWSASSRGTPSEDPGITVLIEDGVTAMAVGSYGACWDGPTMDPDCSALDGATDVAIPGDGEESESEIVAFAVATEYACALYPDGTGACAHAPEAPDVPAAVSGLFEGSDLAFIDAGRSSTCVIDGEGALSCAGARDDCDIDDGMVTGPCIDDWSPSGRWLDVATANSSCAVADDGTLACHGDAYLCPTPEGNDYVRVALTPPDVCGLHADGRISCTVNIAGIDVDARSEHLGEEDALDCQAGHPSALHGARCENVDAIFGNGPC